MAEQTMKILIAGAGYLGLALSERLQQEGAGKYEIFLARRSVRETRGVKTIACDFTDAATLKDLPAIDAIYYAVAADESTDVAYEKAYLIAVRNLVEHYQNRGLSPRFYLSSSTSAYAAKHGEVVTETSTDLARTGPSRFIVAGEELLLKSGLEGAILRYGGIYGPERTGLVERIREGKESFTPNLKQYTNRIHRDDAAGIVAFLLSKNLSGMQIINAVDRESELRDEVIRWVLLQSGKDPALQSVDREAESKRGCKRVSSAKLQALGYSYRFKSFREGYASLLK